MSGLLRTLSLCARHVSFAPVGYVAGDVSFCIVTCMGVQSMSAMSAKTFFVGQLSCMVAVDLVFVTSSDWFAKWSFDARVLMRLQQQRGRPARLCLEIALFRRSDLHVMERYFNDFEKSMGVVVDPSCWCACFICYWLLNSPVFFC